MSGEQYLRIFIASPSDVPTERTSVYKIVRELDDIFSIINDHSPFLKLPRLRAIGWEQVAPDAGAPNNNILERFPIEDSDIFIFILWKRFGSATGTRRADGSKYPSGTLEEFERAFALRKQNGTGRPVIMLYRKKDEFSVMAASVNERRQFNRVANFFEECGSNGKHTTNYSEFFGTEFESNLRKHLVDNILKLQRKTDGELVLPEVKAVADVSEEPSTKWLNKIMLMDNPFRHRTAEEENDILKYYVRFKGLQQINIDNLIKDKNNWLIFGREGNGKSALRRFLFSKCENHSDVITIQYEKDSFAKALTISADSDQITLSIVRQLSDMVLDLKGIAKRTELDIYNLSDPSVMLLKLLEALKKHEINRILFLFDPVDEMLFEKQEDKVISVLGNLASISVTGIGFRFFLPKSLQTALYNRQHAYIGKCTPLEIKWETDDLLSLIRQRLIFYSKDKRNVIASLGSLGEPKEGMGNIDQSVINLSEGNPRAIIWLADQIIQKHCQNNPIPLKIQLQTWDKVQEEWWAGGRNYILGSPGFDKGFWRVGENIYFKKTKLKLSKRSNILLAYMIDAEGQLCTKDNLSEAGWKNESKAGISMAALREAIRRLKVELKTKNRINPNWVKTIHNQGYQLQDPASNTQE
jgi:Cdc6-like AAA superfamily ATPase